MNIFETKLTKLRGIGPKTAEKIVAIVDAEKEKTRQAVEIDVPFGTDVKIAFFHNFGYNGLKEAEKIGGIDTYCISDHNELKALFNLITEFGQMEAGKDTYAGAVVTLEFGALNE
tara:strand:+ start:1361 stop:1705 length:345 start_codon:yes stop_codon:yes gene_type:complete